MNMMELPFEDLPISTQCVDDAEGCSGVIIYDDKEFPLPINQETEQVMASGDEHNSSVRVFQTTRDTECYDVLLLLEPVDAPNNSNSDDEEDGDEDE